MCQRSLLRVLRSAFFFFCQYGNEIVLIYKGLNTTGRVGIKIQRNASFCTVIMFICTKRTCNNLTENGILDAWSVNWNSLIWPTFLWSAFRLGEY